MSPELLDGDIILCIQKKEIREGDIVVAKPAKLNYSLVTKRVEKIEENLVQNSHRHISSAASNSTQPVIKSSYSYFLLGDNRENSIDSRDFGPVNKSEIICVAKLIVANADSDRITFSRFSFL